MTSRPMPHKPASFVVTNALFMGRSIRHSLRNLDALLVSIALPIMLMVLFTYVFGGALDPSGQYVNYVVPGVLLLCTGFGSSHTAVEVAEDMTNGMMDRFRTLPISSLCVIIGHVVASLARNLVTTAIVIGVALALGFRPIATVAEWLAAAGLLSLIILTFTWLYAAIGLVSSSPAAASGYGFVLLFLPYLSSAFVPTNTMPVWLRGVAERQPITPMIETLRGLLTGTPLHDQAWWTTGWCLIILLVSVTGSARAFRRQAGRR